MIGTLPLSYVSASPRSRGTRRSAASPRILGPLRPRRSSIIYRITHTHHLPTDANQAHHRLHCVRVIRHRDTSEFSSDSVKRLIPYLLSVMSQTQFIVHSSDWNLSSKSYNWRARSGVRCARLGNSLEDGREGVVSDVRYTIDNRSRRIRRKGEVSVAKKTHERVCIRSTPSLLQENMNNMKTCDYRLSLLSNRLSVMHL